MDEYVFGAIKDERTNLIPSFHLAASLHRMLSSGTDEYEILYCCEDRRDVSLAELRDVSTQALGFDVAAVGGDYWSIVGDIPLDTWADRHRHALNEFGLFDQRDDAIRYLSDYRTHEAADWDVPFDVVYVMRVATKIQRSASGQE